jgi:hypothetical protein
MTLFTFGDVMTSSADELKTRLERIRLLLHRLNRVRDSAVEAEIITQLTLETEAVRRAREAALPVPHPAPDPRALDPKPVKQPAADAPPNRVSRSRRLTGGRARGRAVRRAAR